MKYFLKLSGSNVTQCLLQPDWEDAPEDAVEVTSAQHDMAVSARYGVTWSDGNVAVNAAPVLTLDDAKTNQYAAIDAAYAAAVQLPVSFETAGGITKTFQTDLGSQTVLMQTAQGYGIAGTTPTGFYWVAADNTQVPFILKDLQGLYQAMLAQGWSAFQKRQSLKAEIASATDVAAVQSIVWE